MPNISLAPVVTATTIASGAYNTVLSILQNLLNGGLDAANLLGAPALTAGEFPVWNGSAFVRSSTGLAWTAYAPAWTSTGVAPVLGNGALTGHYTQIGKTIVGRINLTMGSTTTFGTGNYNFGLPVTANANEAAVGVAQGIHVASYGGLSFLSSTTTLSVITFAAPGSVWGQLVPVTWVSTDQVVIKFTYEAA